MTAMLRKTGLMICVCMLSALALPALGQTTAPAGDGPGAAPAGGGGGGGGDNGNRARWSPQNMQQRFMDRLKQQLGSTDEEFTALQPKLEKVVQLRRDTLGNPMRLFGRRGGDGGGGQGAPAGGATPSAAQQAAQDLQTTLEDSGATAAAIKAKLDAVREARSKAKEDLAAAQTDLKSVLTQRQEAVLVMAGLLD